MTYLRSLFLGLAGGTMGLTIASEVYLYSGEPISSILTRSLFTTMMVGFGALPSASIFILIMAALERRFDWARFIWVWLVVALVAGLPAALVLNALTNMGDPAPGVQKHWSSTAFWASLAASALGGIIAWLSQHYTRENVQSSSSS